MRLLHLRTNKKLQVKATMEKLKEVSPLIGVIILIIILHIMLPSEWDYLQLLAATVLTILVFFTGCLYTVRTDALTQMYIAFFNVEVYAKEKGERLDPEIAGRKLRHANYWGHLYKKNSLAVGYCLYSIIAMSFAFLFSYVFRSPTSASTSLSY